MEHLDKRIATIANKHNKKETIKKTWEEQLSEMVEDIHKLNIELDRENTEMKQLSLFDDNVLIYMPKNFVEMPLNNLKTMYPTESRPQLMYQNDINTINIGFLVTEIPESKEELLNLRNDSKKELIALSPSSKIFDMGDFIIDETHIAYYTFNSYAVGGQMFNLVFFAFLVDKASNGNKFLLCNLNCLQKDMNTMKSFFYGIMKTIEIKKIVHTEQEETTEHNEQEAEKQEELEEQLIFEKEQLLSLSVTSTLSIRDYRIFICKNENGETPLNNIYALNEEGEFLWAVNNFSEGSFKSLPNKKPFISMEERGLYAIMGLDEVETDTTEYGYYVQLNEGRIIPMDLKNIREGSRLVQLREEEKKRETKKTKPRRLIF
ncbi:MAG: hypothetical protein FWE02_03795 [Defluviitaleaceae bacterium]|nr:hypothetical protein [Defluviitaleaceae bacterium]